jgi:hypothetical protein
MDVNHHRSIGEQEFLTFVFGFLGVSFALLLFVDLWKASPLYAFAGATFLSTIGWPIGYTIYSSFNPVTCVFYSGGSGGLLGWHISHLVWCFLVLGITITLIFFNADKVRENIEQAKYEFYKFFWKLIPREYGGNDFVVLTVLLLVPLSLALMFCFTSYALILEHRRTGKTLPSYDPDRFADTTCQPLWKVATELTSCSSLTPDMFLLVTLNGSYAVLTDCWDIRQRLMIVNDLYPSMTHIGITIFAGLSFLLLALCIAPYLIARFRIQTYAEIFVRASLVSVVILAIYWPLIYFFEALRTPMCAFYEGTSLSNNVWTIMFPIEFTFYIVFIVFIIFLLLWNIFSGELGSFWGKVEAPIKPKNTNIS